MEQVKNVRVGNQQFTLTNGGELVANGFTYEVKEDGEHFVRGQTEIIINPDGSVTHKVKDQDTSPKQH